MGDWPLLQWQNIYIVERNIFKVERNLRQWGIGAGWTGADAFAVADAFAWFWPGKGAVCPGKGAVRPFLVSGSGGSGGPRDPSSESSSESP